VTEVTDVLLARQATPDRFGNMVAWSVGIHAVALAILVFGGFDLGTRIETPRTVMTISLGGAPGPNSGMTPMGGRAVPETTQPAPPRPVPAPQPQRTTQNPAATRTRPTPPPQTQNRTGARTAQPAAEEPRPGSTRTETGARGQGFGLATGGGGGTGVQLDVTNFCCPEYIQQMTTLIQRNWANNQGLAGSTVMKFTINRSGTIDDVVVETSSGFAVLDDAARLALLRTRLPELPPQYPNATLTPHVTFVYQR
jgi:protein TonB